MAPRNGRTDKQLKQKYEKRTDDQLRVFAIAGLFLCGIVNASVIILAPSATKVPIPDFVFWGIIAALVPDFLRFLRGDK